MNIKKIILYLLIVLSINFILPNVIYGATTIDKTFEGADAFVEEGSSYNIDTNKLNSTSKFLYNALLAISMVIAVIIGMILGIKYMTSGSEEKASVKETLVPYIVSCCVVFGAFTIWKIIISILQ